VACWRPLVLKEKDWSHQIETKSARQICMSGARSALGRFPASVISPAVLQSRRDVGPNACERWNLAQRRFDLVALLSRLAPFPVGKPTNGKNQESDEHLLYEDFGGLH